MTVSLIRPEMFKLPKLNTTVVIFYNLHYFKQFHKLVNGPKITSFGPARRFDWNGKAGKMTALGGMIGAPLSVLIADLALASGAEVIYAFGSAGSTGLEELRIGCLIEPEFGYDETGICHDYMDHQPFQTFSSYFNVDKCRAISSINSFFRLTRSKVQQYRETEIQLIDMEAAPLNCIIGKQGKRFHPLFVVSDRVSASFEWENGGGSKPFKQGLEQGLEMLTQI